MNAHPSLGDPPRPRLHLVSGVPDGPARPALDAADVEAFIEGLSRRNLSEQTLRGYRRDLLQFVKWNGGEVDHAELDDRARAWLMEHLEAWRAATVRRRASTVRAYGAWAGVPGVLSDFKLPAHAKGTAHPLKNGMSDVDRLYEAANNVEERVLIALLGYMGLRLGEATGLKTTDVDLERQRVLVRGKGAKERWVPIPSQAAKAIQHQTLNTTGTLVSVEWRQATRWVKAMAERAGLHYDVKTHDLRHTFGSHVNNKGGLRVAQELLGHADPRTTAGYTHIHDDQMREAMEL